MECATEEDKQKLDSFFTRSENRDKEEIERDMERLEMEIESLEEAHSEHQGFMVLRTLAAEKAYEGALRELREQDIEKKFKLEKERLAFGPKPKIL